MDGWVWDSSILGGDFTVFPWHKKDWGKKKPASSCLEAKTGSHYVYSILPREITYLNLFIFSFSLSFKNLRCDYQIKYITFKLTHKDSV